MPDVWNGDILLPNGVLVTDIGLASQNVASSPAIPSTSLRFLAAVDTARIPLYLAAGPSLDVWTTTEATEAWFESIFFSKPNLSTDDAPGSRTVRQWWNLARSQTPIGILVQVQEEAEKPNSSHVTEILFYGTIAADSPNGIPGSPGSTNLAIDQLPELQVHALPLSSHFVRSRYTDLLNNTEAQFLSPLQDSLPTSLSPKRKRDLFEKATIANRKVRGKGGQGISALVARGSESQQPYNPRRSLSTDLKGACVPDSRLPSTNGPLSRPTSYSMSRSSSLSLDTRPQSRKDQPDAYTKRSTLSQVAMVPNQHQEPTTESRNKEALSKIVMTAMRMHGLQQKKKSPSSTLPGSDESRKSGENTVVVEEVAKDEEYKLIYHQTFKGAILALRKHIAEKPLHAQPDRLRDVVEQLLSIFLTDPLADSLLLPSNRPADPVATPGGKHKISVPGSAQHHTSPFDLPSIARRPGMMRSVTEGHPMSTGSPVSKRRTNATQLAPT